jgi:hypothetical protein
MTPHAMNDFKPPSNSRHESEGCTGTSGPRTLRACTRVHGTATRWLRIALLYKCALSALVPVTMYLLYRQMQMQEIVAGDSSNTIFSISLTALLCATEH